MNDFSPAQHPKVVKLTEENSILREELTKLLVECSVLVQKVKPSLLALYQTKIGAWELKLLRVRSEAARNKRMLELAQAAMNQGKSPDWTEIEGVLELEFLEWTIKIREAMQTLQDAESRAERLLSPEDSKQLKKLYYALVKQLHPDLNPELDENQRLLWLRAQEAYDHSDIEELKVLTVLTGENSPAVQAVSSLEQLRRNGESLRKHIMATLTRIEKIQKVPPFTLRENLQNQDWVDAQRVEIERQITEQQRLRDIFLERLEILRDTPGYGQQFSAN